MKINIIIKMSNTTKEQTITKKEYQCKCISFTWNGYQNTPNWQSAIETFARNNCEFLCYGKEVAPTTGTLHLQGYMVLNFKKRPSTVRNLITDDPQFHTEMSRKCKLANFRYCSKEGTAWVWDKFTNHCGEVKKGEELEKFKLSGKAKKENLKKYNECVNLAKQGKMEEILDNFPQIYLQYKEKLEAIRLDTTKHERMYLNNKHGDFFKCHFLWLWGATGLGKSYFCTIIIHLLNAFYSSLSQKTNQPYKELTVYYKNKNKWWDRYNDEEIVIIEEASPDTMKTSAHYYKQWIDEYPFNPEIKGSTINYIRPKFIIITSNYSLEQCFTDDNGILKREDYEPLSRRLEQYHLKKRETPNWPNWDKLIEYELTLEEVKTDYNSTINNLIQNINFNTKLDTYLNVNKKRTLEEPSTSENKKPKPFTEEEILNIENNIELNELKRQNAFIEELSPIEETTEPPSEITEPSQEENIITLMMINQFSYSIKEEIACIKCFKKMSCGLFCKDCATPKEFNKEKGTIKCNRCKKTFTALIDAHCPECTIYYKERCKNMTKTTISPDGEKTIELSHKQLDSMMTELEEKEKQNNYRIMSNETDVNITPNLYNIQNQINWLLKNIFNKNKNVNKLFYGYTKTHNNIPSLLMVRQALKKHIFEINNLIKYYKKKYDPNIIKNLNNNKFDLNKDELLKRNATYLDKIYSQENYVKNLNRLFFALKNKLLKLDDNLKLKAFKNEHSIFDYINHNNIQYITINYYEKDLLNDLLPNKN